MAPFMIALVLAAVIAIICEPSYRRLHKHLPRSLAGGIITAGVSIAVLAPLTFVGVSVVVRLSEIVKAIKVPNYTDLQALAEHPFVIKMIHKIPPWVPIDRAWLQEQGLSLAQKILEAVSAALAIFIAELPGLLLGFAVVIVATYFFIVDGQKFALFLRSISPLPADKSDELFNAFSSTCRGVVLGMLASSAVQAALIFIFFAITGVPNNILWTSIAFIMGMVPVIGVAPVTMGGIIYHAVLGQWVGAFVMAGGSVIIGFSDNIVRPWVLKGHGEMHPLLGLVSAFGAVSVLGPTGIILGPVIAAVFVAFLQILSQDMKDKIVSP
jgi:predicted PurR-regulated permease PerM